MDFEERFVAAVMGVIWGAVLGFLLALLLYYQTNQFYSSDFWSANWVTTVSYSAAIFGLLGLVFKASVGTAVGFCMDWVWVLITRNHERGLLFYESGWIRVAAFFVLIFAVYVLMKTL